MEYSEELVALYLRYLKNEGYTDTIIIEDGSLYAVNEEKYFTLDTMKADKRLDFYDEGITGSAWSLHAVTLNGSCKGVLLLGGEIYAPWELTQEIRNAFDMPPFSSDSLGMAA